MNVGHGSNAECAQGLMERKAQAAGPNPRPKPRSRYPAWLWCVWEGQEGGRARHFPAMASLLLCPWVIWPEAQGQQGCQLENGLHLDGATFKSDSALVRQGVVGTRLQGVFENAPTTEFVRNMRVPVFQLDLSGSSSSGLHD